MDRRTRAEPRLSSHAGAATSWSRSSAAGRQDGDVLAHASGAFIARRGASPHPGGGVTIERAPPPVAVGGHTRARLVRRAKWLSWLSLGWMTVEGAVAVMAGIVAGSVALVGFGVDSAIEGIASVIVIWRFTGSRTYSHTAEERAQKLVAASFFVLAPYIAQDAIRTLAAGDHPETSLVGIGLSIGSVVLMPLLGRAKH